MIYQKNLINKMKFIHTYLTVLIVILIMCNNGCSDKDPGIISSTFFGDTNNPGQIIAGKNIVFSKYVIISDNNKDGIPNKGETIYMQVYLKNTGSSTAKSVSSTMTTTSTYVSGISPTVSNSFGDITAGAEKDANYGSVYGNNGYSSSYSWRFTLASTTPTGTVLTFNLAISDEIGRAHV